MSAVCSRKIPWLVCCLLLLRALPVQAVSTLSTSQLDPQAVQRIFSGRETMHFAVSWSGGIKIGDLVLTLSRDEKHGALKITARVTDYGLFRFFYPVDDLFTTRISPPLFLPFRYEVLQREGHGGKTTRRLTEYDQAGLRVRYRKNDQPVREYKLEGAAYNEFSSFYITRALRLTDTPIIVPTFVDGKRHEVEVVRLAGERVDSLFGQVTVNKIMPKMHFKGLYDKDGDTVFWLTDDACRVPVRIESKILIGSLVAELEAYENPACPERTGRK